MLSQGDISGSIGLLYSNSGESSFYPRVPQLKPFTSKCEVCGWKENGHYTTDEERQKIFSEMEDRHFLECQPRQHLTFRW